MAVRRLGRREVRELLDEHGIRPSKGLGQNFVVDPNTVERIARLAAVGPSDRVLEIGAGLGALTLALAATGASVTAVEIDASLAELLRALLPETVRLVVADALRVDWDDVLGGANWVLVANLPYNVAATLVLDLLEGVPSIERMLVMVQREVAERLAATPGGREYGATSVRVAYFATSAVLGHVSPEVFHPRPNVESSLLSIARRTAPAVDRSVATYEEIGALVRAGFAGRRKMLRRSLVGLIDDAAFVRADVAPTARAEELDVAAWGRLAEARRVGAGRAEEG